MINYFFSNDLKELSTKRKNKVRNFRHEGPELNSHFLGFRVDGVALFKKFGEPQERRILTAV